MSFKRRFQRLVEALRSESANRVFLAILILAVIFLLSGSIYSLTAENPIPLIFLPGGSIRVFLWSLTAQTHAETMVIFLYYLMGIGGLWLYANVVSKPTDPRTAKYMLFFSFLLILLASLGLYNAYTAKFMRP